MKDIGVESVHRARVLIYQRHIRVGHQVVASPSFLVREKNAVKSPMHFVFGSLNLNECKDDIEWMGWDGMK